MKLFDKCPVCGDELTRKKVEKILLEGTNTAAIKVYAEVCLHCGEQIYSQKTIKKFEEIRNKLAKNDLAGFTEVGKLFRVA